MKATVTAIGNIGKKAHHSVGEKNNLFIFNLAIQTKSKEENKTIWINCKLFVKNENIKQIEYYINLLDKGAFIYLEGEIEEITSFENKGQLSIIVKEIKNLAKAEKIEVQE